MVHENVKKIQKGDKKLKRKKLLYFGLLLSLIFFKIFKKEWKK